MTTTHRARCRTLAALGTSIALALAWGVTGPLAPARAADAAHTFLLDDLTPHTKDADLTDGLCRTATGTCTMRAAVEQANALATNGDTTPVFITPVPGLSGTITLTSNTTSSKMTTANPFSVYGDTGAYYWVTAPNLTVDFGGRIGIEPGSDAPQGTGFYVDAPDVTIQNFTNLMTSETSIVVSARGTDLLVRGGSFTSPFWGERAMALVNGATDVTWRDIHVGELFGPGAIELAANATVTNLTVDRVVMDNGAASGLEHYHGINGGSASKLVGLRVTGSTFSSFKSGYSPLNIDYIAMDGALIEGNQFLSNNTGTRGIIRIGTQPQGARSVIRSNVFDNRPITSGARAIQVNAAAGASLISIADNYFVGYSGNAAVYLAGGGTIPVERNRFGTPSYGYADSRSEAGTDATLMRNGSSSTNGQIRTWYPTASTYLPDLCAVDLTVVGDQTPAATTPVTLDVFYTATDDAEVYLTRLTTIATSPTTLRVPYTGGSGYVRLQTLDAAGRSSQYSRVAALTAPDSCAPLVTVEQAASQPDPTNNRDIRFVATFSEPVAAPSLTSFSLAGSTAPGARVTAVTALDPVTFAVVVRVDGSGTAVLSLPAGAVQDPAGRPSAVSTSQDNAVTFSSPLAITPVDGTLTTDGCASYQIVEVADPVEGYPAPTASIAIGTAPDRSDLAAISPQPVAIDVGQQSATVTVCAAAGVEIPDGTLTITHSVTSSDPAFDGLVLAAALVPMVSTVPRWSLSLAAEPASGKALAQGQRVAYTASVSHLGGRGTTVALTLELAGALDDASWVPGSLVVIENGVAMPGTESNAPSPDGTVSVPSFALPEDAIATVEFQLEVASLSASTGDKSVGVTVASLGETDPPLACTDADPTDESCRTTDHPIAAIAVTKTGPAVIADGQLVDPGSAAPADEPAHVRPGPVTWAYAVTNIGSAPLRDLAVTDDQGVAVSCPATELAPGAHMVCLGTGGIGGTAGP